MSEKKETFRSLTVNLPVEVIKRIQKDIEGTSFTGVEHFIETLVLQKYPERKPVYTEEEEEIIRERLRKLGYIE